MSPSTRQSGSRRDRLRFDDDNADRAARWLDRDIVGASKQRRQDAKLQLAALIRGMDKIARVRAWRAAELRIAKERGRDPRSWVLDRLDEREQRLEEIGERPDRLTHGPREPCDCCSSRDELRERVAALRSDRMDTSVPTASSDAVVADAFATDGGEPRDGE